LNFYDNVAVLIPTYEMASELKQTLECLQSQKSSTYFQIVIVDDSVSDDVDYVVSEFSYMHSRDVKYIRRQPHEGFRVASAWNILWRSADVGDDGILILTNSHILMRENWVAQHLAYHRGRDNVCVLGPYHEGGWGRPSTVGMWDDAGREKKKYTLLRCYSDSIRKRHLAAINGWDEVYDGEWGREDVDLAYRLQNIGIQWVRGDEVDVVHLSHAPRQETDRGIRNLKIFYEKFPELRGKV